MPPEDTVRLGHLVEAAQLVHHYFDIDLDVPWATVRVDLPALLNALSWFAPDGMA